MSDERFFEQVKTQFEGFSPEVPQGVYGGMRRKLWWSKFTSPDMHRFNMWYLLLFVGMASAGTYALTSQQTSVADLPMQHEPAPVILTGMPESEPAMTGSSCGHASECATAKKCSSTCSTTSSQHVAAASSSKGSDTVNGVSSTPSDVAKIDQTTDSSAGDPVITISDAGSINDPGAQMIETDGAVTNTTKTTTDKDRKRKPLRVPVYGDKK